LQYVALPPELSMRIAVTNSFPNLIHSAEREFMQRFATAASRIGHEVVEVITSNDILACNPDFVLCMHEFTPKLTDYPTFGVMWSPPQFYRDDAYRNRTIRSYDAYLVGSDYVRQYLIDLEFQSNISKPKSDFYFLPMAPARSFEKRDPGHQRSLVYVGVHWDGARHGEIITDLAHSKQITVYGPRPSWAHLRTGYGGEIDFDGQQLLQKLSSHGIALCLHRDEHRRADTPSMRLFEAAAAGCVIITDEIPYAKRLLDTSALYVDLRRPAHDVVDAIRNHVAWITANPEKARELARGSHEILNQQNSLESLVSKTCQFAKEVHAYKESKANAVAEYFSLINPRPAPVEIGGTATPAIVDIIVRCGSRDVSYLKRVVSSVESQSIGSFRILLIDYKQRADIQQFARSHSTEKTEIKYIESINNGFRSTALWKGLSEVKAPFFAVMDDDDAVMPDHYCNLLFSAMKNTSASFFYCGVVRVEEDGEFMVAPNFNGPLGKTIEESRELKFLDAFNLERLLRGDNYIQSNAWIAKRDLLSGSIMDDPYLKYAEDMYLYYILMSKTEFVASNHASAYWYWRSRSRDNSMFDLETEGWRESADRTYLRLGQLSFPRSATLKELLQEGRLLTDIGYSLGVGSGQSTTKTSSKKYGPIKSWLLSIPAINAYHEKRRRRRRLRRLQR
jgi:Glycosyl transferase family 2/Glycosyl transferases group 1